MLNIIREGYHYDKVAGPLLLVEGLMLKLIVNEFYFPISSNPLIIPPQRAIPQLRDRKHLGKDVLLTLRSSWRLHQGLSHQEVPLLVALNVLKNCHWKMMVDWHQLIEDFCLLFTIDDHSTNQLTACFGLQK
jgi:hypothetical protein